MVVSRISSAAPELPAPPPDRGDVDAWTPWLNRVFAGMPARFWHSVAVHDRIARLRPEPLGLDEAQHRSLRLAALLHDIGHAGEPRVRVPHAFSSAAYLESVGLSGAAAIAAHHSGSRFEAAVSGIEIPAWAGPGRASRLVAHLRRSHDERDRRRRLTRAAAGRSRRSLRRLLGPGPDLRLCRADERGAAWYGLGDRQRSNPDEQPKVCRRSGELGAAERSSFPAFKTRT
ncbi:MAG: HD domain-containing protein [Ilumatobacteraceae bacterium]